MTRRQQAHQLALEVDRCSRANLSNAQFDFLVEMMEESEDMVRMSQILIIVLKR